MFTKRKGLILALAIGFIAMPLFFLKAQANEVFNFYIFRRGNGGGDIIVKNLDQELLLSCGDDCARNFKEGDNLILSAKAREGSRFVGWSINQDSSYINPEMISDELELTILSEDRIHLIYPKFELVKELTIPAVDSADLNIPRVMFWPGKVNQHWDLEKKVWATDSDGFSGSRENKLEYCRRFYPETEKVVTYKEETTNTWKDAGNRNNYTSTKTSYRCVLRGENVVAEDVSNSAEQPNKGSVCYWFPDLPLCLPLSDPRSERSPFTVSTSEDLSAGYGTGYEADFSEELLLEEDKNLIEFVELNGVEDIKLEASDDEIIKVRNSLDLLYQIDEPSYDDFGDLSRMGIIRNFIIETFQSIGAFFNKIFTRK